MYRLAVVGLVLLQVYLANAQELQWRCYNSNCPRETYCILNEGRQFCAPASRPLRCYAPKNTGACNGPAPGGYRYIPKVRYFYDFNTGMCESFRPGQCPILTPDSNDFASFRECREQCIRRDSGPSSSSSGKLSGGLRRRLSERNRPAGGLREVLDGRPYDAARPGRPSRLDTERTAQSNRGRYSNPVQVSGRGRNNRPLQARESGNNRPVQASRLGNNRPVQAISQESRNSGVDRRSRFNEGPQRGY